MTNVNGVADRTHAARGRAVGRTRGAAIFGARPAGPWLAIACLTMAHCSRPSGSTPLPAVSSHDASTAATADLEAGRAVSGPSGDVEATTPLADPVLSQVTAWNRALDRHDVTALDGLYAQDVCFYGQRMTKSAILESKRRALSADGTFQQQIVGAIEVVAVVSGESAIATFVKRSGDPGHLQDVRARIFLKNFAIDYARPDAKWSIAGENEANAASKPALDHCESEVAYSFKNIPEADSRCDEAASEVFGELPEVKRAMARMWKDYNARVKDEPNIAVGGFGPQENGDGSYTVARGLHTDERFEDFAGYRVDRSTGRLEVSISGEDSPPISAPNLRKVEAACKP
jgi:hypothetical protein